MPFYVFYLNHILTEILQADGVIVLLQFKHKNVYGIGIVQKQIFKMQK